MSRYIDADALDIVYEDGDMTCVRNLDAMPTVDAVPVVRCKDCKWWTNPIPIEMKEEGYGYCGVLWTNTHEDEYCAWGERRSDEQQSKG